MSLEEQLMEINSNNLTIANNCVNIYNKGFSDGKKSEYDAFWDAYQENGRRRFYANAFGNSRWNDATYKPKYDIQPLNNYDSIFAEARMSDTIVNIDFSLITSKKTVERLFAYNTGIVTIRKIITNENIVYQSWFSSCTALENLTFEGVIGQNGLDLHWSTKLSKNSWISIINALSSTTTGLTITGSLASVKKAFETSAGANDGNTSAEWKTLTDTKPNWTISLV